MTASTPYVHRSEVRVRYAETDQMGVVYHANYLVWCEIGRTDFIRALGRSYADLERDGITLAVSDAALRFVGSAQYDDPIVVHTQLDDVRSRSMRFAYRIEHAETGRSLVTATTSLVALDRTGKPSRLPDALLDVLRRALGAAHAP
jgi:acyl-CoA thioester hydrolase